MQDYQLILIVISVAIVVIYLTYLIATFCFMNIFQRKISNDLKTISVLIFQKREAIHDLVEILFKEEDKLKSNLEKLKSYDLDEKIVYQDYKEDEVYSLFNKEEEIYKELEYLIISKKGEENNSKVKVLVNIVEDINKRFTISIQLFNSNVIGFNYWRNSFTTKWIKRLFKIKEHKRIE